MTHYPRPPRPSSGPRGVIREGTFEISPAEQQRLLKLNLAAVEKFNKDRSLAKDKKQ